MHKPDNFLRYIPLGVIILSLIAALHALWAGPQPGERVRLEKRGGER